MNEGQSRSPHTAAGPRGSEAFFGSRAASNKGEHSIQRTYEPHIHHRLPGAPIFTGRTEEMEELRRFWRAGPGVLSLVGAGGAGKTALCDQFLRFILAQEDLGGLFVWSFYDEPDANVFLRQAYQYFAGQDRVEARGTGWFHALKESLSSGGKHVLVLDGLERIQRPITEARGVYGELEDPLLRGLLRRLVAGVGEAKVVITSRFPVSDLESWLGKGYMVLDVDQLDLDSAYSMLRNRGVQAGDAELATLVGRFGRHALTLDLLAGAIVRFFEGRADQLDLPAEEGDTAVQSGRLAHTLDLFLKHLPERSVDLLVRMCVFRFGVTKEALIEVFARSEDQVIAGRLAGIEPESLDLELKGLEDLHLVQDAGDVYSVHPAVRDHFYRLFRDPDGIHGAVSSHLMTLTGRPGVGLPTDNQALDLLEELIYHALKAGKHKEAAHVYFDRMGGNDHLNVTLGEYVRTYRILRAFPQCPDASAMYHCLRAFGRFEEALQWRPQNNYILILEGELAKLAREPSNRASKIAWFLRGETTTLPERLPDFPLCVAWMHLCKDAVEDARRIAMAETEKSPFLDDVMRNRMVLAEAELRLGRSESAESHFGAASEWVLRSSSHEHLCLIHGLRANFALTKRNWSEAAMALDEACHLADESNFRLLVVDLMALRAELLIGQGRSDEALDAAKRMISAATDDRMGYVWGERKARQLEARILSDLEQFEKALESLENLASLQRRIDDSGGADTERKIAQMRGAIGSPNFQTRMGPETKIGGE